MISTTESVPDVAHQLNKILEQRGLNYIAINAAVEEQTIASKQCRLTPQDLFIRDNITSDDILVVSLGGNDIALKPTMKTIFAMGQILLLNDIEDLENLDRKVTGFASLQELFVDGIREYIGKLTEKTMPGRIVVTTLYYMSEMGKGWADTPLKLIGYDSNPLFIQALLRRLSVEMKKLLPEFQILPLWRCLDGKTESDYIERVEPSVTGGEKMARYIIGSLMERS